MVLVVILVLAWLVILGPTVFRRRSEHGGTQNHQPCQHEDHHKDHERQLLDLPSFLKNPNDRLFSSGGWSENDDADIEHRGVRNGLLRLCWECCTPFPGRAQPISDTAGRGG